MADVCGAQNAARDVVKVRLVVEIFNTLIFTAPLQSKLGDHAHFTGGATEGLEG